MRAFEDELDFLTRCLRRHGISAVDAEDLVQDVFVVMCRRWEDFQQGRPLRPWLAGIAYNVAQGHLRRHRREVPRSDLEIEDDSPGLDDRLLADRARARVLEVLAKLPERHRSALVMHELDGMAVAEMAATLGIPLASAYTRVRRARLAFASTFKRQEEKAPTSRRLGLVGAEALYAFERQPPPVAAGVRERAVARARTHAADLTAAPAVPRARTRVRPLIAAEAAGLAAAIAALVVLTVRSQPNARADAAGAPRDAPSEARPSARAPRPELRMAALRPSPPRLFTAPASASESLELARGLTGYWRFDDGPHAQLARDASPHGNHCVLYPSRPAAAWVEDARSGLSLGPGGRLECGQDPVPAGAVLELSGTAWIRIDERKSYQGTIVNRQMRPAGGDLFLFAVAGNQVVLRSRVWAPEVLRAALPETRPRWIHVAFTRRRDGLTRIFVDGKVAAEQRARPRSGGPVTAPVLVASGYASPAAELVVRRFPGAIDEVMLYDRALDDDEVAALAAGVAPSTDVGFGPLGAR